MKTDVECILSLEKSASKQRKLGKSDGEAKVTFTFIYSWYNNVLQLHELCVNKDSPSVFNFFSLYSKSRKMTHFFKLILSFGNICPTYDLQP